MKVCDPLCLLVQVFAYDIKLLNTNSDSMSFFFRECMGRCHVINETQRRSVRVQTEEDAQPVVETFDGVDKEKVKRANLAIAIADRDRFCFVSIWGT